MTHLLPTIALLALATLPPLSAETANRVVVGDQTAALPSSVAIANGDFARRNGPFPKSFAGAIGRYGVSLQSNKAAWGPESENARILATLLGGPPADQAAALNNLSLVPAREQASNAWLPGNEKSGAAKILEDTAGFLKEQKKITADYVKNLK